MEKRRTIPVKLDVGSDDAALLKDTVDEFLWAANYVTRHAFEGEYVSTSKTTLNDETYENVRDKTELHSNHVQAAQNKAADACKSVVEKWKQGKKASIPHFTSPHLVYDHRTATFHDECTRNAVATCRNTGRGGHTRLSRQSDAKRKAGSSRRSTASRTSWWLKPAKKSVR